MKKLKPDNYFIEAWIKQNPTRLRTKRLRKKYYKNPFRYITGKLKEQRFFARLHEALREAYAEPLAESFDQPNPLMNRFI